MNTYDNSILRELVDRACGPDSHAARSRAAVRDELRRSFPELAERTDAELEAFAERAVAIDFDAFWEGK